MAVPIFWLTWAACSLAVLMASVSVPSSAFFRSAIADSTSDLTSSGTLSAFSERNFSVGVGERLGAVADLGLLAALAVLLGVLLGVGHHPLDVVLAQRRAARDGHGLLLAGAEVLGRHVHDAVGVDVERDLDLRDAARRRSEAGQLEHAELLVVRGDLALALEDLDLHRRLVVVRGGEDLRALGRDRGVALDQLGEDAALGLDAQRQRGHVQQQDVLDLALEHAGLQAGADGDDLVRVDALVRLLAAGQLLDQVDDGGHPGRAADQHDVVDVAELDPGVLDHLLERRLAPVEQVRGHLLELGPGQLGVQVQRALLGVGDVGQVDLRLGRAGQLDLGLLRGLPQPLQRHLVLGQVDAVAVLEVLDQPVHDPLVPVVAAEVVVAAGRLDLDDALADLEQRDVEGAAAEVEDQDGRLALLLQVVGQRGGGGLVDDAQHVQPRDLAGLLGGLPLRVAEVRGHGDHRVGDRLAQVGLRVPLQLLQDEGADLLRGELLAVDRDGPVGAHLALDRADGPVNVGHRLPLGDLADEHLAVLGERDDGRAWSASPRRWR